MSDIYFYQADSEEEGDTGAFNDNFGSNGDSGVGVENEELGAVAKLDKYCGSENMFNRQMVARTVLETLRQVVGGDPVVAQQEIEEVFEVVERLAGDTEPSVRAELMEQVPHIAMFCQELSTSLLGGTVPNHLLPLVVKFLTDTNNQVRKTSQAALLVLLEQGLVEKSDVEKQVCPVILRLTEADSMDDYRTEAVALMSKMAPLIGKQMAERIFLDRFASLCTDPLFHVRKVCAANFGDFSGVVGSEPTEQVLLPKFFYLCEDGVWGVRKACADVFMPVSCVCSPQVRQTELSPLFINLLRDQSRWVRMAAFQALGPFISTFADPSITALLHNENGEIVITNTDQLAEMLAGIVSKQEEVSKEKKSEASISGSSGSDSSSCTDGTSNQGSSTPSPMETESEAGEESSWTTEQITTMKESPEERRAEHFLLDKLSSSSGDFGSFDSFSYWREPVLEINLTDLDDLEEQDVIQASVESVRAEMALLDTESSTDSDLPSNAESSETKEMSRVEISTVSSLVFSQQSDSPTFSMPPIFNEQNPGDESKEKLSEDTSSSIDENTDLNSNTTDESTSDLVESIPEAMVPLEDSSEDGYASDAKSDTDSVSRYHRESSDDLHPPDPALPKGPPCTIQTIVPQLLIDHYVSMIDPSRAQTVDNDIARHCAFSLPAVALTLGRHNWPLLKETYETLANDMQWKVRRTLASSIHELGVILGEENAAEDLVPIFNGFIKDLDEVRIGILKHLADFLKLLGTTDRTEYLPKLSEFLKMDNQRNWRFRLELTQQVGQLVGLFPGSETRSYLAPIAVSLVQDKVAAIRLAASEVLSNMLVSLSETDSVPSHVSSLVSELVSGLARSSHWARRQTYVTLSSFLLTSTFPSSTFIKDMLPPLLELTWDKVPNVRLSLTRVLVTHQESLSSLESVEAALSQLQRDTDKDVREAADTSIKQREASTETTTEIPPQDDILRLEESVSS